MPTTDTLERFVELVGPATKRLEELRITNVVPMTGDGSQGWSLQAPFDRIMVTAAAESVPAALVDQLREGGVMVLPVGAVGGHQELLKVEKTAEGVKETRLLPVRFVPLVAGRAAAL